MAFGTPNKVSAWSSIIRLPSYYVESHEWVDFLYVLL